MRADERIKNKVSGASDGTVARVVRILTALAENGSSAAVSDLAAMVNLPVSTVHRLLHLLAREGIVIHESEKRKYHAGTKLLNLAYSLVEPTGVSSVVGRFVNDIAALSGESGAFVIYNRARGTFIFVQNVNSNHPPAYKVRDSKQWPAHTGSTCLSILAQLPEETAVQIARSSNIFFSRNSGIQSINCLVEYLKDIREQGFSMTYGPLVDGAMGFSAPVFGNDQEIVGSLCVHMPVARYTSGNGPWIASIVKHYADKLSHRFTYQ